MDSVSKNKESRAADFVLDRMMLKDNAVVEVYMEESEKVKARSAESKTMETAGESKDVQLM